MIQSIQSLQALLGWASGGTALARTKLACWHALGLLCALRSLHHRGWQPVGTQASLPAAFRSSRNQQPCRSSWRRWGQCTGSPQGTSRCQSVLGRPLRAVYGFGSNLLPAAAPPGQQRPPDELEAACRPKACYVWTPPAPRRLVPARFDRCPLRPSPACVRRRQSRAWLNASRSSSPTRSTRAPP